MRTLLEFDEVQSIALPAKPERRTKKPATMVNRKADHFQTEPAALELLYPFVNPDWCIWEPACGKGNLAYALGERGYSVIASDAMAEPLPTRSGTLSAHVAGADFLAWDPAQGMDGLHTGQWHCSITNPPFSLKEQWLARCYALGKPFALLMPLTALEGQKWQALFAKHGVEVIVPSRRIDFETPNGHFGGSYFMSAWFTWGLGIGKALTFAALPPRPKAGKKVSP